MIQKVYEIIDASSDEMYYPLGVFLSLDAAKKALVDSGDDKISEYADEYEDIKIEERDVGWSGNGRTVLTLSREIYLDDNGDEKCRTLDFETL